MPQSMGLFKHHPGGLERVVNDGKDDPRLFSVLLQPSRSNGESFARPTA
jgi:hypothetical protein